MSPLSYIYIIPVVMRLVLQVEALVSGSKQGVLKKDLVTDLFLSVLDVLVSFGLVKDENAKLLRENISPLIDELVAMFNRLGLFSHTSPS